MNGLRNLIPALVLAIVSTLFGSTIVSAEAGARDSYASSNGDGRSTGRGRVLGYLAPRAPSLADHGHTGAGTTVLKGGRGCSIACIKTGVAYAVGTGAYLEVTTDGTPVNFIIGVDGVGAYASGQPYRTKWGVTFPHLDPGKTYTGWVRVEDKDGYDSFASGTFKTLRRFARVSFGAFDVDEYASCCDSFEFYFRVAGEWQPQLETTNNEPYMPGTALVNNSVMVDDAPRYLDLAVQVAQYTGGDICEASNGPYSPSGTHGDWCMTWNTASPLVLDLDTYDEDETYVTDGEIDASFQACCLDSPLRFTAPVHIDVWYA